MIKDILEKSKAERKVIGIWLYGDDEGFWSGYVRDYTEEFVVLQHFTKYGKPDGLIIERLDNIESIDFDNDYARAMEHIIQHASEIDQDVEVEINISNPDSWQHDILDPLIGDNNRIVRIHVNKDNYYCGLVEWCDEDSLVLNIVGNEGQDEGKSMFKVEDINSIRVNDIENRKKLLLYKWRQASSLA